MPQDFKVNKSVYLEHCYSKVLFSSGIHQNLPRILHVGTQFCKDIKANPDLCQDLEDPQAVSDSQIVKKVFEKALETTQSPWVFAQEKRQKVWITHLGKEKSCTKILGSNQSQERLKF